MEIALSVLGLVSIASLAALVWVCNKLVGTIKSMGDQLTANSGHQLERIKYETGAEAVGKYVSAIRPNPQSNGYAPGEVIPDFVIPNRVE